MSNIDAIKQAKNILEYCEEKDEEYYAIIKTMDKYLYKHCNHKIVKDLIDIDPDRSKTIYYCEICELTFNTQKNTICKNVEEDASYSWLEWYYPKEDLDAIRFAA